MEQHMIKELVSGFCMQCDIDYFIRAIFARPRSTDEPFPHCPACGHWLSLPDDGFWWQSSRDGETPPLVPLVFTAMDARETNILVMDVID